MYRRGYKGAVSYIDDFFLACETYEECKEALLYLINFVRKLGLRVSWNKVVSPAKNATFLGVDIDTNDCVLSALGADKLRNMLHDQLKAFKSILDSIKPLRQAKHKTKLARTWHGG